VTDSTDAFDNLIWPPAILTFGPTCSNKGALSGSAKFLRLQPGWSAEEGAAYKRMGEGCIRRAALGCQSLLV
jgi:hypothetical protein